MDNEGAGVNKASISLPPTPFLYTIDQVATLLSVTLPSMNSRCYFIGRTTMRKMPQQLVARNISPPHMAPDWRIGEEELIRWLREMGYRLNRRKLII